jgi:hypothetical protein
MPQAASSSSHQIESKVEQITNHNSPGLLFSPTILNRNFPEEDF